MYVFWCSSNIYTYIYICVYVIVSFKKMDHDNINNDIQTICNIQYVHSCFDVVSSWYQHTPRPRWNLDAKASFMLRSLPNAWGFCCMLPKSSRCLYQFGKCVFATSPRSSNKKHTKIIANFSEKRTQDKHDLVLKISFEKVRNEKKKTLGGSCCSQLNPERFADFRGFNQARNPSAYVITQMNSSLRPAFKCLVDSAVDIVILIYDILGGGFKYFLCSPLFGEDFQFDWYFSNGLKPPTSIIFIHWYHFISHVLILFGPFDLLDYICNWPASWGWFFFENRCFWWIQSPFPTQLFPWWNRQAVWWNARHSGVGSWGVRSNCERDPLLKIYMFLK